MIHEGFILTRIAEILNLKKSHVSYYLERAKGAGLVNEVCRDRIKILKLTQAGSKFLDQYRYDNRASSRRQQLPTCRAENVRFKAQVYRLPTKPVDWKRIEMNNWHQYSGVVDNIKIHLNNGKAQSVEFIPSPIDGNNPFELFGILYYDCNQVARELEQALDMEIGRLELEPGTEWLVCDPLSKLITKYNGQISVEELGKINASRPLRRGEIEYFDPMFAADYISMPMRVSNIERLLEDLLKRNKEYIHGNSENQIDEEQDVEDICVAAEQVNDKVNNSNEEAS